MVPIALRPGALTLTDIRQTLAGPVAPQVATADLRASERAAATVAAVIASGRVAYGINTGFGLLASTRIPDHQVALLQRNLVLSHAVGTGGPLPDPVVRLILLLKVNSLLRGNSGVRAEVINALLTMITAEALPVVPAKGSVGASGDLAPLAHLVLPLLGEGEMSLRGQRVSGLAGMAAIGLEPLTLQAKEGLALLNGTQVSTAIALAGLLATERVFDAAIIAGALSVDAASGSDTPFDPRIHALRGQPGQITVARRIRALLTGSEIRDSHRDCGRVQDPYCLRCQPQVMGACLDLLRTAAVTLLIEANAVTDNPLVFPADDDTDGPGDILSGGNFHAEPVAFAADQIALALAEIGNLSERRSAMLVDPHHSGGLPAFLVRDGGLNSGFMIAQVTAAALTSENRGLAHPASIDTIPTSANQEDHVSMATRAAWRTLEMADNAAAIVAVELLEAAQGIDLRRPLQSSPALERVHAVIRSRVAPWDCDRLMAPDLEAAKTLLKTGAIATAPDESLVDWLD